MDKLKMVKMILTIAALLPSVVSAYTFSYPVDKLSGYYTVPNGYCLPEHCGECMDDGRTCAGGIDSRGLYTINPGYTESFTYTSNYPIYGAWEIRNHNDFRNKCFVGDCTKGNKRFVACVDGNSILTLEKFTCNKWVNTYEQWQTKYCVDGHYLNQNGMTSIECSKPTTINFYYDYNTYPGYEGYSEDWRNRWESNFNQLNNKLNQYGINLVANYYEYKMEDNSAIPSALYTERNVSDYSGDIDVIIPAGKQLPQDYGFECPPDTRGETNACAAYSAGPRIRIPDYYDYSRGQGYQTLVHEVGHSLGCSHTGEGGTLSAHLYMNDIMSYGQSEDKFLYECRIALWLLGGDIQQTCNNQADTNSDCSITLSETTSYANKWIYFQGNTITQVINAANIWINGGSY